MAGYVTNDGKRLYSMLRECKRLEMSSVKILSKKSYDSGLLEKRDDEMEAADSGGMNSIIH